MKSYLQKRVEGISLTQEEAQAALGIIARGEANNSHIAAFLTTYMMNPITSEELPNTEIMVFLHQWVLQLYWSTWA